jgi:uncharacterized membrane protein SirB2
MSTVAIEPGVAVRPARVKPPVVPLQGLPIVAVIVGFVVYAIASNSPWALMICHVGGGGLWTSIDLFVGLAIGPIIGSMSPMAQAEFSAKFMPKMVLIMPTVVTMTLASGLQLALIYGNLEPSRANHSWLVASMIVVGIMAVIALGILEPANITVLMEMRKDRPNPELIGKMMKRFIYTAGITGVMQVATILIMTRVSSR